MDKKFKTFWDARVQYHKDKVGLQTEMYKIMFKSEDVLNEEGFKNHIAVCDLLINFLENWAEFMFKIMPKKSSELTAGQKLIFGVCVIDIEGEIELILETIKTDIKSDLFDLKQKDAFAGKLNELKSIMDKVQ